ncbi:outer membrane receptor protein involved in Fe transport [Dokdonella fugitiva]|uniref:Outer membrane receptor protein involved in Fe transport n=1 Tax=Dokdonella fugitiva TaxID=328517 RepID=A0A839F6T9_9GAMM|nr:TonB-dependent receptor [Dokdonella fugitiva]MBA8889258.1 outer membrane receptor protein involved in Fe transport [Dokdonella fugitiva]
MRRPLRMLLLCFACSTALAAQAQVSSSPTTIDLPAGDLATALNTLARQSGTQLVYRADQLKGVHTPGVHGATSTEQALDSLLRGSGFSATRDASSGAVLIERDKAATERPPATAAPAKSTPASTPAPDDKPVTKFETLQVTGSRIPRAQIEGPAPITVITAAEIKANGFTTVPDVLRAMTQNGGETQSQQSASGADFSPGAQQVDLRGLGPNHTLVLVNGRRIADFPMPFKGRSNFTDISSIPIGMIDRIEVLTGSASAIYGSDAISGVVNFILKKHIDGTILDVRAGTTTEGGGSSFDASIVSGFEHGDFSGVYSLELTSQNPLWAYDRDIQDSTLDAPTESARAPRRAYLRTDDTDTYLDPGRAACDALASQNHDSTYYASRPGWGPYDPELDDYGPGYYCGSDKAIGYGTILSKRRGINGYASLSYAFGNGSEWFADIQAGHHTVDIFRDVTSWSYMAPDGNEEGYFSNQATGGVEFWQRQFSPEEMGGLNRGMIETTQRTFGITTGFKGTFGESWNYEASLSHSRYEATISWPQIVAARANALFLGEQLGVDEDGLPIFDADPSRLYTPLTRAEYDSIAARTVYHPESETSTAAFTASTIDLFALPGGDAGFSGTVELGQQSYDLNPDPLATQYYYYSWRDSDGHGSRNRWATAGELRMPVLDSLDLSVAGRYDQYRFSGRSVGKATWSTGLEWRPIDSLLVRGSYGTAFRAPDLHYVYAGVGNDETSGIDYYNCLRDQAEDCEEYSEGLIRTREGNRKLDPETSKSWTAGFVWSPLDGVDLSLDWFDIDMRNQVQDMSVDSILRDEASCRLGTLDIDSPTCVDALARITRSSNGSLYGIYVNPINVARETTSGVDLSAHYRFDTTIGRFTLSANHTWVRRHDFQQYAGDRVEDEFALNSGFDIPRTKTSASVTWEKDAWSATLHGERLGRLPNGWSYDQVWEDGDPGPTIAPTYRFNASAQYTFGDHARLSLAVTNLFNKMPPRDPTYTAYPYYDISWFDAVGRTVYVQYTQKFGGSPL